MAAARTLPEAGGVAVPAAARALGAPPPHARHKVTAIFQINSGFGISKSDSSLAAGVYGVEMVPRGCINIKPARPFFKFHMILRAWPWACPWLLLTTAS